MTNIRFALQRASILASQYSDWRLEAEILLSWVLEKDRSYLFAYPEEILKAEKLLAFEQCLNQRLEGRPIAYITGIREFWSLSLKVNPCCLIPRPETERIVELALELLPNEDNIKVLDLGTGCGTIALALAKEQPNWQIDACDIHDGVLELAKSNALAHHISNVRFYQSDWFKHLPSKRYHAILSNPPYIAAEDPHLLQGDLRFEPRRALSGGQDGLTDLHYIISSSVKYLLPQGLLLLEHGFKQKKSIHTILNKLRYRNINCWQDFQGHDRVSGGRFPGI